MINSIIDLENKVLASAMTNEDARIELFDKVKSSNLFTDDSNRIIYTAIKELYLSSEPIDCFSIGNTAGVLGLGSKNEITIAASLLIGQDSSPLFQLKHCLLLVQEHTKKTLKTKSLEWSKLADSDSDSLNLLSKVHQDLAEIEKGLDFEPVKDFSDLIDSTVQEIGEMAEGQKTSGHPTGLYSLDKHTGGIQNGQLWVVAGRPGMGKTAFALKLLHTCAQRVGPALMLSIEMTETELVKRLIAANIDSIGTDEVFNKGLSGHKLEYLKGQASEIKDLPIYIESKTFGLQETIYKIKKFKEQKGVKMVVIDYLQLMNGFENKNYGSSGSETLKITDITRSLKQLAKTLDIPIILLSQLNRKVEDRGGSKRPLLSDLKQSGSIEEDANLVIALYRPEYYAITEFENGLDSHGVVEFMILKNRNGQTGSVRAHFNASKTSFDELC